MKRFKTLKILLLPLLIAACSTTPQRWGQDEGEAEVTIIGPLYSEQEKYDFKYPLLLKSVINEVTSQQKELLNRDLEKRMINVKQSNWFLEHKTIQEIWEKIETIEQGYESGRSSEGLPDAEKVQQLKQSIEDIVTEQAKQLEAEEGEQGLRVIYESNPKIFHRTNAAWEIIKEITGDENAIDNTKIGTFLSQKTLHENRFTLAIRIVPPSSENPKWLY